MKKTLLLLITSLFFSVGFAQNTTPKTAFTKMYLPVWFETKAHCLAIANAMPEEKYTYKPTEESKTLGSKWYIFLTLWSY